MKGIGRRAFVAGSAAAMFAAIGKAPAQDYPTRPVTFIIPFPPGGSTTIVIRSISDRLGELLGQQIIIDNRRRRRHGRHQGAGEERARRLHDRARL